MHTESIASALAGQSANDDLVLEEYGAGLAWLRPAEPINATEPIPFTVTDSGRDALRRAEAMRALFGQPWPTVAEACV